MRRMIVGLSAVVLAAALSGCSGEGTPNSAAPNPTEGSQVATKIPPPMPGKAPAAPAAPGKK